MKNLTGMFATAAVALACAACSNLPYFSSPAATSTADPALEKAVLAMVGESLDSPRLKGPLQKLISQEVIAQEFTQFRYAYPPGCVLVVNAYTKARRITEAWTEGPAKSCRLAP